MDGLLNLSGYGLFLFLLKGSLLCQGQYFDRNKVNYPQFSFRVLRTPDFDIHTYLPDTTFQKRFARQTEHWYKNHQAVLRNTFDNRNPFILYNTHAHFQQTRAISGLIYVGTGGGTEGL